MARAFETGVDEDCGDVLTSLVEAEECVILIDQVDALIGLLTPDGSKQSEAAPVVQPLGEEPPIEGPLAEVDSLFEELGLGDLFTATDVDGITDPEDPVAARLFPPGYIGDAEAARDFRRFTESDLRQQKIKSALLIRRTLEDAADRFPPEVVLPKTEAMPWLQGINDLRLALSVHIGIGQWDEAERLAPLEGRNLRGLYDFLTWWQDSLLEALG